MKQCLKAAAAQNQAGLFWLFIHPEDLGLAASGLRPASVWQLSEMRALIPEDGCSFALHLCTFGAASAALTHIAGRLPAWKHLPVQWPSFDSGGSYLGPLQRCIMHNHASSVGWDGHGWRTAAGAAYPDAFSEVVARATASLSSHVLATDTLALPELPHAAESFALELLAHPEVRAQDSATLFHLLPHESPHVGAQADAGFAFFTGAYVHTVMVALLGSAPTPVLSLTLPRFSPDSSAARARPSNFHHALCSSTLLQGRIVTLEMPAAQT